MNRHSWTTFWVAVAFVLLIVGSCVNWREDLEDQANPTPSPTGTLPITVLPAPSTTPLPELTPTYVTPEKLPGLAGTSTPTPIPPLVLTDEPTVTMTPLPVQRGAADVQPPTNPT